MDIFCSVRTRQHLCDHSAYMVGLDPSISPGRFHCVTNLTLEMRGDILGREWYWYLSSLPRGNRSAFPSFRVINIDVIGPYIPHTNRWMSKKYWQTCQTWRRSVSRAAMLCHSLRLIGALRGVRSSEEQTMEDDPRIFRTEGRWELVANRKRLTT